MAARHLARLALLALAGAQPALALSLEELQAPLPGMRPSPADVTPWSLLGKASVLFEERDGDYTATTLIPPEVEALDGQKLKLMGFMFPIEAETPAREFLLVEYPADCPFCLAAGTDPARMVEVRVARGVDFAQDQVIVSGRLEVVRNDANGLVYRLHEAELVTD
jgi:hypothetical protein